MTRQDLKSEEIRGIINRNDKAGEPALFFYTDFTFRWGKLYNRAAIMKNVEMRKSKIKHIKYEKVKERIMDFFSVLALLGGLAIFLYGMNLMGDGLAKVAGGKLERILETLTSSPIRAVLLGMGVTAVIQSSSATTVMVVGFVNSGIMKLSQVVGIIMGANIGTTVTSWILSLTGIQSDNFIIRLFKPTSFSPILALIGVILIMFTKSQKKKDIGTIFVGFAILMYGMNAMSGAVEPLAEVPEFTGLLVKFSNPLLGVVAGAVLTAIIQSSSASVGILQALCLTGMVPFSAALPIIMGQNIGTCITAIFYLRSEQTRMQSVRRWCICTLT